MSRLNKDLELELQPKRIEYAKIKISQLGYAINYEDDTKIMFEFKGNNITLFPYSGWFSGKGVKQGRGLSNLLKQIK